MDFATTLILVLFGILLEAFFSGSEIGMVSVNRIKMKQLAEDGNSAARSILKLLENPERLFTTTSLGTNLAMVASTAIFTAFMVTHFGDSGEWMAMSIISPLIFFGGEIIPKVIFQHRADSLMLLMVYPLIFFNKILSPLTSWLSKTSAKLTNRVQLSSAEEHKTFSRDQLRNVLSLESQTVDLGVTEKKIIHNIFNFGELRAEHCMSPLIQMTAIKDTATMIEAHDVANDSGFSRVPVFHERMYNLIGILNTFDLLDQPVDNTPITHLIRPAYYVPPNKKIDDLLKELQQRGLHMAIVVDEYGGCIGLITIEDLLEKIVGEIEDEYDKPEKTYEPYADGGYLVDGSTEISVLNDMLSWDLQSGDFDTLAGLAIDKFERIPNPGDQVMVGLYRITVKEASKRKIQSLIIRKLDPAQNSDNNKESPPL
ncbi:MAG: HlyC/CorC family transporter [Nitrospina sp.]|jgi:putative hemolysin|nr:HlyC/CorC family transporter [Nitrospina sp.]MBT3510611.1 HlyC/CorC family transporter [Nitrospina sp.]MBT3876107.1 HlyC/CorC family transporter [Nitrospina sp.]MBT4049832.1 HlyC/CorC family transporter [Nitrospina sp.]MBT4556748.1 HlyC/CorC family transporter [Nitrospina sp.]